MEKALTCKVEQDRGESDYTERNAVSEKLSEPCNGNGEQENRIAEWKPRVQRLSTRHHRDH